MLIQRNFCRLKNDGFGGFIPASFSLPEKFHLACQRRESVPCLPAEENFANPWLLSPWPAPL